MEKYMQSELALGLRTPRAWQQILPQNAILEQAPNAHRLLFVVASFALSLDRLARGRNCWGFPRRF